MLQPYPSWPTYVLDDVIVQEVVVTFDDIVSFFFTVKTTIMLLCFGTRTTRMVDGHKIWTLTHFWYLTT